MSPELSNQILKILMPTLHFIVNLLHGFQHYCTRLLKFTLFWTNGNREDGYSLTNIPGPIALPFFGTTLSSETAFENLSRNTEGLLKKYGSLIKCEVFWNIPIVLVYDPDDIDFIVRHATIYRPPLEIVQMYRESRKDRYYTSGIVNTQNEEWKRLRSVLTSTIQIPKYIMKNIPNCDEIANDFVKTLKSLENGNISKLDSLIVRFVAECSCFNVLGRRIGFLDLNVENVMDVFISSQEMYFEALHTSFYGFPWWKYIRNKIWDQLVKCEDSTYDIFSYVVKEEKINGPKGLIKLILESKDIHEQDKVVLAMDLVMGGIEPVFNSIIFTLNFITSHPQVQEKLFEELKSVLPEKDTPIDEEILPQLPYLKSCVQESFRLSPTTPNLARLIGTEIELKGYKIPAHTVLLCQHWHSCLQDKNYFRAKEFIPERWMAGQDGEPRSKDFLPHRGNLYHFGFGRRDCTGRRFATMEISVFLARVFRNFEVVLDAPVTSKFEFLQVPVLPVNARVIDRLE